VTQSKSTAYRGRFAPSPTGPLHFGSLVAAVGSYLDARANQGEWLVRIENIDSPREAPGASRDILTLLEKLGMHWDNEVVYQRERHALYREALAMLEKQNLTYACTCSRKEIADSSIVGIEGPVYPGTCRNAPKHSHPLHQQSRQRAIRIRTDGQPIVFTDPVQGYVQQRIDKAIGDFVLHRADGIFAYQLAVVVDDAAQAITHVVRGADLLNSTPRQIYLQQVLGYFTPAYMHLPVVTNAKGEKMSKQTFAAPVAQFNVLFQLVSALRFLGQNPPDELLDSNLETFWQWAVAHWNPANITATGIRQPDCIT
jgi:glutamyl-Q tRNA(Asp) synthetase